MMFQLSIRPKPVGDLLAAGLDIGADAGSAQAVEGGDKLLVAASVGVAVGGHQQVVGLDVERAVRLERRRSSWR